VPDPLDFLAAASPDGWEVILNRLKEMWQGTLRLVPNAALALVVLVLFAFVAKLARWVIEKVAARARLRRSLVDLLGQLGQTALWVIGILIALTLVFPSVEPGSLLAGLGVTGIVLGFAFKDIAENFFAGVLVLWRFPVEIGDWIEVDGIEGRVERINIRMTELRTVEGDLVILPNAKLLRNPVTNWTSRVYRRQTVICGVAYGEDVGEARGVIERAVKACETVERSAMRPVEIFAQAFGSSSIDFEVTWWTGSTPVAMRQSRDEVVEAVKSALDSAGIEIPFPYRTLTFKEPVRVERGAEAESVG
jgi:small-conductance mechanosensitive channel